MSASRQLSRHALTMKGRTYELKDIYLNCGVPMTGTAHLPSSISLVHDPIHIAVLTSQVAAMSCTVPTTILNRPAKGIDNAHEPVVSYIRKRLSPEAEVTGVDAQHSDEMANTKWPVTNHITPPDWIQLVHKAMRESGVQIQYQLWHTLLLYNCTQLPSSRRPKWNQLRLMQESSHGIFSGRHDVSFMIKQHHNGFNPDNEKKEILADVVKGMVDSSTDPDEGYFGGNQGS
ncbi:hypothetical protein UA08_04738 [Talaromyces atroroseus]|uniref:Uncharacterized protein n=1 Tax=Talaromyces atroroseus TaxID=1441469 RepID=A0A225AN52_TALAT|nr:hypothetical protein UA08_04738 [Talaromyces atroroseus]OKL59784.1 hypothetical protein UA08_04738 [Talaromyces atroroseus]